MKSTRSMESLQAERDALLKYVLLHPPPGVTVNLPPNVKSLDECDLSLCPSPLKLYTEAESSAALSGRSTSRRPKRNISFNVGEYITATYAGGGRGGVVRPSTMELGQSSQSPASPRKSTEKAAAGADGREGGSSSGNDGRAEGGGTEETAAGAGPLGAAAKAAGGGVRTHGGGKNDDSAPSSGFISFMTSLFSNSSTGSHGEGDRAERLERHTKMEKQPTGAQQQPSSPMNSSKNSTSLLNLFSRMRARHDKRMVADGQNGARRASGVGGAPSRLVDSPVYAGKELTKLPLNGTSTGTLTDHILPTLEPLLRGESGKASRGGSTTSGRRSLDADGLKGIMPSAVLQPVSVRDPVVLELCPILDQFMLDSFDEKAMLTVYEILLISVNFLVDVRKELYETEIFAVYRPMFGVSEDQHMRSMANLIPAHLREGSVKREELRLYIESLRPNVRTIRTFLSYSNDEEFVRRMGVLVDTALHHADEPGQGDETLFPLAVRASIFAIGLIPVYRLDPTTQQPYFSPDQVRHCVMSLQHKLMIPPGTVEYCHLHACLLANDEGVDISTQAVFLKHVAKAVNALGARTLEREKLTPDVKYAYYVLQETLSVAMAPMPWLDTLCKGTDAKRSVSAVFVETCAVLPTCFLAAFVRVNGAVVLPPSCSNGSFVYALLSVFIYSVTSRKFGDTGDALLNDTRARYQADRPRLAMRLFASLAGVDGFARDYFKLLERSLPMAPCLALEGRFGVGDCALHEQWTLDLTERRAAAGGEGGAKETPPPAEPVPVTVAEDVTALLAYLLEALPPTIAHVGEDAEVQLVVSTAAARNLTHVGAMVQRAYDAYFASLAARLGGRGWVWGTGTTVEPAGAEPPPELAEVVDAYGSPSLPPPLGTAPHTLQSRRLHRYVESVMALLKVLALPLPALNGSPGAHSTGVPRGSAGSIGAPAAPAEGGAVPGGGSSGASQAFLEFQRLAQLRAAARPLQELLQRLNALYRLQQACARFFSECAAQYRRVSAVTGSAPVDYEDLWGLTDSALADAILALCRWVAAAVVCACPRGGGGGDDHVADEKKHGKGAKAKLGGSSGGGGAGPPDSSLYGTVLHQFMRVDMAAYRQKKHSHVPFFGGGSKEKMLESPLPKAYPEVTVGRLIAQLDDALERCVSGHVQQPQFQQEIRSSAATFLVALLHTVYLEDVVADVFLVPADTNAILRDLDAVSRHYFSGQRAVSDTGGDGARPDVKSPTQHEAFGASTGSQNTSILGENNRGARMLATLRGVVHYVMTRSSATLVNGGEGVPRFSTLPDIDANTPWCKRTVRQVLAHRKDKAAKQALTKWFE